MAVALSAGVVAHGLVGCEGGAREGAVTPEERAALKKELRAEIIAELAAERASGGSVATLTPSERAAIDDARRATDRSATAPPVIDPGTVTAPAGEAPAAARPTDTAPPAVDDPPATDPELPVDPPAAPDEDPARENPAVEEPPAAAEPDTDDAGEEIAPGVRVYRGPNGIQLTELAVGTEIGEREALGVTRVFDTMPDRFFCYTVFDNRAADATVTHVWRRGTRLVSRVELEVGRSPRWRTWSRQRTRADWTGEWSCEVLDAQGARLGRAEFEVRPQR
ncbi:MAG: DUF2914 domain-containing protein [Deltaproteobacteria bacterium]|nr:DUF2914 domain-containing protein [Deltaproteobacteria bacterium]